MHLWHVSLIETLSAQGDFNQQFSVHEDNNSEFAASIHHSMERSSLME
jgi:hypothetical protein